MTVEFLSVVADPIEDNGPIRSLGERRHPTMADGAGNRVHARRRKLQFQKSALIAYAANQS
jgi:hypothetical protein